MMRIIKWILIIVLTPVVLFVLFLVYSTITDYRPDNKIVVYINNKPTIVPDTLDFNLVSWNLGYAGLDKSMDFFYDGGVNVRPSKEGSLRNLNGLLKKLQDYVGYDFVLLQEVDINSKRSYYVDQQEVIKSHLLRYNAQMGINYNVNFVPMPPTNPLGKTNSGLCTLSKYKPTESIRYSFPGNYSWPLGIFMLDRCFLLNRYMLQNGKQLIVINTHNSAYDDGSLRDQQMNYMRKILLELYNDGNYVIAGGDWNQCPNNFIPKFDGEVFDTVTLSYLEKDYPEKGWNWAYDATIPSNRRVITPYVKGETPTTLIDYFLVSPNVIVEEVNGVNLGFEFTDHQPVELKVKLIP